eukprot:366571-Chlamydomonas_euryale.AAC.1
MACGGCAAVPEVGWAWAPKWPWVSHAAQERPAARRVTGSGAILGGRRGLATSATTSFSLASPPSPPRRPPPRRCGGVRSEASHRGNRCRRGARHLPYVERDVSVRAIQGVRVGVRGRAHGWCGKELSMAPRETAHKRMDVALIAFRAGLRSGPRAVAGV